MNRVVAAAISFVALALVTGMFAAAAQLPVASSSMTSTLVAPIAPPASGIVLSLLNSGAIAGQAETADRIRITYPRAIDASSLCPTWPAAPTAVQSIAANNAVVVTINDGTTDSIVVTTPGACNGTFNLGGIDLGSGAFTAGGSLTFSGQGSGSRTTVSYDPVTFQLVITLGTRGGAGTAGTVGSVTATYTPSGSLRFGDGTAVTGTATTTGVAL